MLPNQIVIENDKQEQSPDVGNRTGSSLAGGSNHGKNRAVGNILVVEPNGDEKQNPEDQALAAMTRQPTGPREDGDGDDNSVGSGHSSTVGAARMNSVHRRKLRQQQEKAQGVNNNKAGNKSAAASAYSAAATAPGESQQQGTGARAGNWREMYSVEVSTENGNDAEIVAPPSSQMATNLVEEAGADYSAGGVPSQIVQEVHNMNNMPPMQGQMQMPPQQMMQGQMQMPPQQQMQGQMQMPPQQMMQGQMQMPPQQMMQGQMGMQMPPQQQMQGQYGYAPQMGNNGGYDQHNQQMGQGHHNPQGHYGAPPQGHYQGHQGHDERYAHAHTHQDSYHDVYATPESKPNFAGCNVRFGDLEIRVYERILGDNPSCSSGPPVGIGWNFYSFTAPPSGSPSQGGSIRDLSDPEDDSEDAGRNTRTELVVSLEKYERTRGPRCEAHDLVLARQMREELLVEAGYTRGQMADAVRQSLKVKHQRRQTVTNFKLEDAEEVIERTTRTLKRMFMSGEKRKKTRTSYLYMEWLEQSRHNGETAGGYSQRFSGAKSQSILVANDQDKERRNSLRRVSTEQLAFTDGSGQEN